MVPETFTENFYIIGCGSLHLQPIKYGNNLVMNFHSCEADTLRAEESSDHVHGREGSSSKLLQPKRLSLG